MFATYMGEMTAQDTPNTALLVQQAYEAFRRQFGCCPTHGASAPGRVNLIGEHTDYSEGLVLPMAIQMVTVIVGSVADTDQCQILTLADQTDDPKLASFPIGLNSGGLPTSSSTPKWANYIKGTVATYRGHANPFNAVIISSVPFGKGLSSSASMQVALYAFLDSLSQNPKEQRSKGTDSTECPLGDKRTLIEKAEACLEGEQMYAGLPCGIMDQYISFMGVPNHALLIDCRSLESTPVSLGDSSLSVLVCDSNVQHELTASEYTPRQRQCQLAAAILGVKSLRDATNDLLLERAKDLGDTLYRRVRHVISENQRTAKASEALKCSDYCTVGQLLLESHKSLREDFEVSCPELDQLVAAAMEVEGVYGSRMTGGGFGGCTVTLVQSHKLEAAMAHIRGRLNGNVTFYITHASAGACLLDIKEMTSQLSVSSDNPPFLK